MVRLVFSCFYKKLRTFSTFNNNIQEAAMLAARPDVTSALELMRLALATVNNRSGPIPNDLQHYFDRVVREAKILCDDPEIHGEPPLPESIELAYRIKTRTDLGDELAAVTDITSVTPELAGRLLASMENDTVYLDQFTSAP